MNSVLFKTEPKDFSFADLVRQKGAAWDGVRNPVALKNMKQIKKGDRVFIYHTGSEKAVVGLARAVSEAYPDPKQTEPGSLVVIDLAPVAALSRPVSLATLKGNPVFADSPLVRQGRLSVVPLSPAQATLIETLGAAK